MFSLTRRLYFHESPPVSSTAVGHEQTIVIIYSQICEYQYLISIPSVYGGLSILDHMTINVKDYCVQQFQPGTGATLVQLQFNCKPNQP